MEKIKNEVVAEKAKNEVIKNEKKITLVVERETYESKDKKERWTYFVKGIIRNREVKVSFNAKDYGGYEVLDIVFDVSDKGLLIMTEGQMEDPKTGKITDFITYEIETIDEDGTPYRATVKPHRSSDKDLIKMLHNEFNKKNQFN